MPRSYKMGLNSRFCSISIDKRLPWASTALSLIVINTRVLWISDFLGLAGMSHWVWICFQRGSWAPGMGPGVETCWRSGSRAPWMGPGVEKCVRSGSRAPGMGPGVNTCAGGPGKGGLMRWWVHLLLMGRLSSHRLSGHPPPFPLSIPQCA
jgi:hypothetical protein